MVDQNMVAYPKAYHGRATSATLSSVPPSPSNMRYATSAELIHRHRHGTMIPPGSRAAPQQAATAPDDHSSPRCVNTRPGEASPATQNRSSLGSVESRSRLPVKRTVSKTQQNGQPLKSTPPLVIRPSVSGEEGLGNVERPLPRKNSSARSEESGGDQGDDEEEGKSEALSTEDEVSRKRIKVQHVEDHFEYI